VSCTCHDGYFGKTCDKSEEEQKQLVEQRKNMLKTLATVLTMQDTSPEAAAQQASGIQALVRNVAELDENAKDIASSIMGSVSEGLLENGGVDKTTANSLGESVSSLMTPNLGVTGTDGRRLEEGTEKRSEEEAFKKISGVVDNLMTAQILGQFVGEVSGVADDHGGRGEPKQATTKTPALTAHFK
jgi:hypothetical protein